MRDYLLKMADGSIEHWDVAGFNSWCKENGERIGGNFQTRLDQFRRYTKQDVIDWEMED